MVLPTVHITLDKAHSPCNTPHKLRTAAYCRVSTDLAEQEDSYEAQLRYYHSRIGRSPTMELVGLYGDKGKSGLKTSNRSGLQQLLSDCAAGKIDLILTKSVSRFARNMADCVDLITRLRGQDINIIFEREGLQTCNRKNDLLLSILAALAQAESHSISQNVIRSHEQYAAEGRPFGRIAYGYFHSGAQAWQIHPDEARRVRCAFSMAAEGFCYADILAVLNGMEHQEGTGLIWQQRRVRRMLRHVAYRGDYYSHATVCLSPGHQVVNRGYRDRYYIEAHHAPLVSPQQFEQVQQLLDAGLLDSNRRGDA